MASSSPTSATVISNSASMSSGELPKLSDTPPTKMSGVVYVGHLPFGFFESQIHSFFVQFGYIKRFCLKRSKKNGNSKGYAFIQFKNSEVADVVAKTMDGYFLFGRALVCTALPETKVHPTLFSNGKSLQSRFLRRRLAVSRHNRQMHHIDAMKRLDRRIQKNTSLEKRLKELDIDYSIHDMIGSKENAAFVANRKALNLKELLKDDSKPISTRNSKNSDMAAVNAGSSNTSKKTLKSKMNAKVLKKLDIKR